MKKIIVRFALLQSLVIRRGSYLIGALKATAKKGECIIRIDEELISTCVNSYSDMIFRMALHHTKNVADAEDITQEVFVSLLKKPKINDMTHLKAWLLRVAINKCKDLARSAAKRKNVPLESAIFKVGTTDEDIGVFETIQKLAPLDRNIVFLHYYEGYSAKEVAKIVGKSEGAIYTRLTRLRGKLKSILEDEQRQQIEDEKGEREND